jgi:thymidylate synthase (FAD)
MVKVELIEYTSGGIDLIANLARSTRKNDLQFTFDEQKNEKFVKELIKIQHLGILEHITFTFHISEISRILTHQLVRHRMASYLQQSGRHVKPEENGYVVPKSMDNIYYGELPSKRQLYIETINNCYKSYNYLLEKGVPVEDARYLLPPAFYTQITVTMNCRAILHFLELRLDTSAQWEIAELACKIYDEVYDIYPIIFECLSDLRQQARERLNL